MVYRRPENVFGQNDDELARRLWSQTTVIRQFRQAALNPGDPGHTRVGQMWIMWAARYRRARRHGSGRFEVSTDPRIEMEARYENEERDRLRSAWAALPMERKLVICLP